MTVTTA